jgi:phospholipid/cholesterol/gamma-HCH transport system substrate-binding protein
MDDRVVQFRVGVMVLASLLITGILVVLFGEMPRFAKRIFRPTYTVRLWFPEGRGLAEESLVRRNGIVIGRVSDVQFAGEEPELSRPEGVGEAEYSSGVLVTAEIQQDARLYEHDVGRIETDLLGKPSLHFTRPEQMPPSKQLLDASRLQRGQIAPDPLTSISAVTKSLQDLTPAIRDASQALGGAGKKLEDAAQRVSAILDDETRKNLQEATKLAKKSLTDIQEMIGDEEARREFRAVLKGLPDSLQQLTTTMQKAQSRLDEVQAFTEKLGSRDTVDRLDRATRHLDQVMQELAVLSESLRDPRGSLGLLLQDRQLYDHLTRAAENVDNLSRQLQPVLNDVRVFTDKVARHPERLGAQGLLQRYPGIK